MIPHRYQEETENHRLRDELAAAQKAMQDFVYMVSHDLGAPLRAVTGFSRILQQKYASSLDEKGLTYLDFIVDGGVKMQMMLTGLLQYSRVHTQAKPAVLTDLNLVLEQVCRALDDKIDIRPSLSREMPLPTVLADVDQMRQLFQAVLDNAVTYRHAHIPLRIAITTEETAAGWKISITDNGLGIPIDDSERVFQVFKRLHTDETYPGVGMGLPIARRIVERHGGLMGIKPAQTHGTVCWFMLPRAHANDGGAGSGGI